MNEPLERDRQPPSAALQGHAQWAFANESESNVYPFGEKLLQNGNGSLWSFL
jgi:hypothetical protein